MKKLIIFIVVIFTLLSGCNLIIGFLDGDKEIDVNPLPANIFILNDTYVIPFDGPIYPIGNTVSNTEKIIDFTVENRGETALYLYGNPRVQLDGEGFSLKQDTKDIILPGDSSIFSISFIPPAEETYKASIIVESSDTDKSPYHFYLTGTGTEIHLAGISIRYGNTIIENGDLLDIGSFKIGNEKKEVFHLKNIGSADLVLDGTPYVRVSGEGFSLIKDAESPVEPDTEVTYQIGFLPARENAYGGTIRIESNDPDVPEFIYTIEGYGIQ